MAPPHNNQATNCGKLWQQIVSSFTKLENLTAMPVLNFAHPPHEKKDEAKVRGKTENKGTSSAFQSEGFVF